MNRAQGPAVALLVLAGLLGVLPLAAALAPLSVVPLHHPDLPALAWPLLVQVQIATALLGAGLLAAAAWPALRPAAIGAAMCGKLAFVLAAQAAPLGAPGLGPLVWVDAAGAVALGIAAVVLLWPEPW